MDKLWKPIAELANKYQPNLLFCAPELVDLDCNTHGIGMGYWQDGEGLTNGSFLACKWNMTNDEWDEKKCTPTHFMIMRGPHDRVLRNIVFEALDNAYSDGLEQKHPLFTDVRAEADSLLAFCSDVEGHEPEELTPHIEAWLLRRKDQE